jgi:hypothetical protein
MTINTEILAVFKPAQAGRTNQVGYDWGLRPQESFPMSDCTKSSRSCGGSGQTIFPNVVVVVVQRLSALRLINIGGQRINVVDP